MRGVPSTYRFCQLIRLWGCSLTVLPQTVHARQRMMIRNFISDVQNEQNACTNFQSFCKQNDVITELRLSNTAICKCQEKDESDNICMCQSFTIFHHNLYAHKDHMWIDEIQNIMRPAIYVDYSCEKTMNNDRFQISVLVLIHCTCSVLLLYGCFKIFYW